MIIGLNGEIIFKEATRLGLNVSGVIYEVFISVQTSSKLPTAGSKTSLQITHIIREDAWGLFGFLESSEKKLFDTLIKINGVGPKAAMAILSTYEPQIFANIVEQKDIKAIQRVPGIGPKSAGRILVDLAGWSLELTNTDKSEAGATSSNLTQAQKALLSLGYKNDAIAKALKGESGEVGEIVKSALKKLSSL